MMRLIARKEIVELLIAKGANMNAKDEDGETPLDLVVGKDSSSGEGMLIEKSKSG